MHVARNSHVGSDQSALSLIAVPKEDNKNKVIVSQLYLPSLQGFAGWGPSEPDAALFV